VAVYPFAVGVRVARSGPEWPFASLLQRPTHRPEYGSAAEASDGTTSAIRRARVRVMGGVPVKVIGV
jgi:hypothetical protein